MELIVVLVFGSTVALVLAVAGVTGPRPAQQRLTRMAQGASTRPQQASAEDSMLSRRKRGWWVQAIRNLGASKTQAPSGSVGPLRERLIHAGYRGDSAVPIYLGSRIAVAILAPMLAFLHPAVWSLEEWRLATVLCAAAGFGYVLPGWWVDRRRKKRQTTIEMGLPDALDMMVVCVEAGVSVNASLVRVAAEFRAENPVLATELELVTLEIRTGKSTTDALRALADRTGVSDISSLVALLVQTDRFGTSVAQALRIHADSMRVRRMQRAEEYAAKVPLKMIFPTVVIFLASMIVLLTPAMIQFSGIFEKN